MVSPFKNRKIKEESNSLSRNRSQRKCRYITSLLKSKRIYIHTKTHTAYTKYETKLKSFGAEIAPYLDENVSYVITDLPGFYGKNTLTASVSCIQSTPCYSVSPITPGTPATPTSVNDDGVTTKKTRTRADAMLEKITAQPHVVLSSNPIVDALSWKIPIYSLDSFQKYLDGKLAQLNAESSKQSDSSDGLRIFTRSFLKLESCSFNLRPEFRDLAKWPVVNLNTPVGSCPFDKTIAKRKAEKDKVPDNGNNKVNRTCNKSTSGYCEICSVHYIDLSHHVKTDSHLKFVCDDNHYTALDNCIKTRSVDTFLAANHVTMNNNSHANKSSGKKNNISNSNNNNNCNNDNSDNNVNSNNSNNNYCNTNDTNNNSTSNGGGGATGGHMLRNRTVVSNNLHHQNNSYDSVKKMGPRETVPLPFDTTNFDTHHPNTRAYSSSKHNAESPMQTKQSNEVLCNGYNTYRLRKTLKMETYFSGSEHPDEKSLFRETRKLLDAKNIAPMGAGECMRYLRSRKLPPPFPSDFAGMSALEETTTTVAAATTTNNRPKTPIKLSFVREPTISPPTKQRQDIAIKKNGELLEGDEDDDENGRKCNNSSRKRLSIEEKFLEDNRDYYKVEVLRSKLRSTIYFCNQQQREQEQQQLMNENHCSTTTTGDDARMCDSGQCTPVKQPQPPTAELPEAGSSHDPVVMRFKKVQSATKRTRRQTELSVLNIEAENFMFGPSPKMEQLRNSNHYCTPSKSAASIHHVNNKEFESSPGSESSMREESDDSGKQPKKRRTHAEAFIHDNLDYYKFEISGSRLRHHLLEDENHHNLLALEHRNEQTARDNEYDRVKPGSSRSPGEAASAAHSAEENKEDVSKVTAELDSNAKLELARKASARQRKWFESVSDVDVEFGFQFVPKLELWFSPFLRQDNLEELYISVYKTYPSRLLPCEIIGAMSSGERASTMVVTIRNNSNSVTISARRKHPRCAALVAEDKPRKSPRCHASTLAILSSLTSHRRRSRLHHSDTCAINSQATVTVVDEDRSKQQQQLQKQQQQQQLQQQQQQQQQQVIMDMVEQQSRLVEEEEDTSKALDVLAEEIDNYFDEFFGRDDIGDKHLALLKEPRLSERSEDAVEELGFRMCTDSMDTDFLRDSDIIGVEICEVLTDMVEASKAAEYCDNLERAANESPSVPRCNDLRQRGGDNNNSYCNSSDAGASSTCEFLGFSDDYSAAAAANRRRKRKRPNMTGWPHDKRKKKLRMLLGQSQLRVRNNNSPLSIHQNHETSACNNNNSLSGIEEMPSEEEQEQEQEERQSQRQKIGRNSREDDNGMDTDSSISSMSDTEEHTATVGGGCSKHSRVPNNIDRKLSSSFSNTNKSPFYRKTVNRFRRKRKWGSGRRHR